MTKTKINPLSLIVFNLLLIVISFSLNILFTLKRETKMLNVVDGLIKFDESQVEVNRQTINIFRDIVEVFETLNIEKKTEYKEKIFEGEIFEGEVIEIQLQ